MTDEPEDQFGAKLVREMHQSRLDAARSQYEASINRLWAGCGGGLIGVVTALRHPTDCFFWLSSGSFGLGVLFLGVGAVWTLVSARAAIRHLEDIDVFGQMRVKDLPERPSDEMGLTLSHPLTWTALAAAGLFMLGVVSAAVLVWRSDAATPLR
jgi:hypothetical protein